MIARLEVVPYEVAFLRPLRTAQGAHATRTGLWVVARDEAGRLGFGEAAPLPGLPTETLAEAHAALARCARVELREEEGLAGLTALLAEADLTERPAARSALSLALLDLLAQRRGARVVDLLGGPAGERVSCHALLAGESPEELSREAAAAAAAGFRAVKVKLAAHSLEEDLRRVRAIREAIGARVLLRGDANGGWDARGAASALERLEGFGFDFIEDPVREGMARLRGRTSIPIAADAPPGGLAGLDAIVRGGGADVLIVKPMAIGGCMAAAELARRAREAGMRVVVTSILDTPIGIAGALQVAAILPGAEIHGLATASLLAATPIEGWPEMLGGDLPLPSGPGLGVRLNEAILRRREA